MTRLTRYFLGISAHGGHPAMGLYQGQTLNQPGFGPHAMSPWALHDEFPGNFRLSEDC